MVFKKKAARSFNLAAFDLQVVGLASIERCHGTRIKQ
jgi:hypothetical protein